MGLRLNRTPIEHVAALKPEGKPGKKPPSSLWQQKFQTEHNLLLTVMNGINTGKLSAARVEDLREIHTPKLKKIACAELLHILDGDFSVEVKIAAARALENVGSVSDYYTMRILYERQDERVKRALRNALAFSKPKNLW